MERFVVRTVMFTDYTSFAVRTTLAVGRAEAVRQAECIGELAPSSKLLIRGFLEGNRLLSGALFLAGTPEIELIGDKPRSLATIFAIDE